MSKKPIEFVVADRQFYAPLESAEDRGETFAPSKVPDGWRGTESGIWTMWHRDGFLGGVEDGWKVHVSAAPGRLTAVLDAVAEICFAHNVPFKHLSAELFYWWTHQKRAARSQSGKFVAAYPADCAAARRLMEALRETLADERGPYILSDRRYRDSHTVQYRYGAFIGRDRVQADGTRLALVRDGNGDLVPDRRGVSFHLPTGIVDPFVGLRTGTGASTGTGAGSDEPADIGGFVVESAVQFTNAGGAYRGYEKATGRAVFLKEARPFSGLGANNVDAPAHLRAEWETLTALHALAPGLVPEPISHFRAWEHEFLVTELIEGEHLGRWLSAHHPLLFAGTTADDFARYYERCERIIRAVEHMIDRIHALGYVFVDLGPGNVLVDRDDNVRLVDFETAQRLDAGSPSVGTPGFTPPPDVVASADDLTVYDDYGVAALTQLLMGPIHQTVQRNPDALRHLYFDLAERAPVPPALWNRVTRYHAPADGSPLPSPEEVADDPVKHLTELREAIADALVAMADADHPERVFPTVVRGYQTNTLCVAYGTAGVIHALARAGRPLPDGVLERLRRDALAARGELAPGLHVGLAGIAWVLADRGLLDEARDLLALAGRHPLTGECATLSNGSAGVALTHLALYGRTGDERHLDEALALAASLPSGDELVARLGPDDATGLLHGRCGIALMLQQLADVTGDASLLARAVRLLHAELDRAADPEAAGLLFPVSANDSRNMPYLYCGSAGMVHVATRCLRIADDERLAAAMPRLLAPVTGTYTVMPALYPGLAGFAFTLADHAQLAGDPTTRRSALRVARGLFKYALPHATGVRFLGEGLLRYSADLWSGSAGILLALTQVLDPRPGTLFTVDAFADERSAVPALSAG